MARTNKYTPLNFNDIYEKKLKPTKSSSSPSPSPSPSSSSSSFALINTTPNHLHKTHLSAARTHGRMLVLTRPTPKPIPIPQPSPPPTPPQPQRPPTQSSEPDQNRFEQDSISLRPLGLTGSGPSLPSSPPPVLNQERDKELLPNLTSRKPDQFVPPPLRPGFVGREERLGPEVQKQTVFRPIFAHHTPERCGVWRTVFGYWRGRRNLLSTDNVSNSEPVMYI